MDLKNLESTSIYALEAVYQFFWNLIPRKYKLEGDDNTFDDIEPFYDPTLTFDNRLHYKLVQIPFPEKDKPWFVITWNTPNGLINSSLTRRRFQSAYIKHDKLGELKFKFINTDLEIMLGICCNSMSALYELQENIILKIREKLTVSTKPHSLLGSFPVSLNIIDSQMSKLDRNKGTLCYLTLTIKTDYPIIGEVVSVSTGVIKEIHSKVRTVADIDSSVETDIIDYKSNFKNDSIILG